MSPEPYDRQPGESAPAWEAFVVYRDMGLSRSGAKVVQELGKSKSLIERWSRQHSWVIRASSFDKHMARVHVTEIEEGRRLAAQQELRLSTFVFQKIDERLKTLPWDEADFLDIRRMAETWGRIRRLALGAPTEAVEVTGPHGGPMRVDYTNLTDEERIKRMRHLHAEVGKRLDAAGAATDE